MDKVRFVTDERLDVPDAHALGDMPAELFERLCKEFFGTYALANGQRVAMVRPWDLTDLGGLNLRVSRDDPDGLLFDLDGKVIGGAHSALTRDVVVTGVAGTYYVNVRWAEVAGATAPAGDGEGVTEGRRRWDRTSDDEDSLTTNPRRLDSWEVLLSGGVLSSTVDTDSVGGAALAAAGWITIGVVTVAAGAIDTVTVRDRSFAIARDWSDPTVNAGGRVQASIRSIKEIYDALATQVWELKAHRSSAIGGWFAAQLSGLTERGIILPSDTTGWAGPQLHVKVGAGERGRIRVAPDAAALTTYLIPDDDVASAVLSLGRDAASQRARAVLESAIVQVPATQSLVASVRDLSGAAGWTIGDEKGHIIPRSRCDFDEDFLWNYTLPAAGGSNERFAHDAIGGGGGSIVMEGDSANGALGVIRIQTAAGAGLGQRVRFGGEFINPFLVRQRLIFRVAIDDVTAVVAAVGWWSTTGPRNVSVVVDPAFYGDSDWHVAGTKDGGGAITAIDTGVPAVNNTYVYIDMRFVDGNKVDVYIGLGPTAAGPFQADASSGGGTLPNVNGQPYFQCTAGGGAARIMRVDRFMVLGDAG